MLCQLDAEKLGTWGWGLGKMATGNSEIVIAGRVSIFEFQVANFSGQRGKDKGPRTAIMISEITGDVLYDRIQRHSLLVRVQAISYEIFVPSGIASRLRFTP